MAAETTHQADIAGPASVAGDGRAEVHGGTGATDDRNDTTAADGARRGDSASSIDHVEDKTPPVVVGKRQKIRRHCGRFWLWYLIGSIILLAILLPILFKVILPVIVQAIVDKQDLPVKAGALYALSPTELSLSLNTTLDTPLPAHVSALTLNLFNKDTPEFSPFTNVTLPATDVNKNTKVTVTNQTVSVQNETEIVKWFNAFFNQEVTKLSVKADPKVDVHLGILEYNPHLTKTIDVQSLNHFKGFGTTSMQLMLPENERGHNVKGTLNLPNSGVLVLGLGNLTLNVMCGDVRLGLIGIDDVVLELGNNTKSFEGNLFLDELLPNIGTILDMQKGPLSHGVLELNATGNSTMVNGEHIPYLESVVNNNSLTFTIPVVNLLSTFVNAFVGGGKASILDIFGDVLGNSTLIESILEHFQDEQDAKGNGSGNNGTALFETRQATKPKRSMMMNMMRLAMKTK